MNIRRVEKKIYYRSNYRRIEIKVGKIFFNDAYINYIYLLSYYYNICIFKFCMYVDPRDMKKYTIRD